MTRFYRLFWGVMFKIYQMFCMALFAKFYIMAQVEVIKTTRTSYENGCSPRPNLTHNRVTRLVVV